MSSGLRFQLATAIVLVSLWCLPQQLIGAENQQTEVWLVTYGSGEVYYERFGHNALWLKNPARNLDHIFNFGFFDFNQANFLGRFLSGNTLYFAAARNPAEEFSEYIAANRSIDLQRIKLNPAQYMRLENYLLEQVQPANRDYRYQYFRNNCSTRVRDAIDIALSGGLRRVLQSDNSEVNIRQQIHASAMPDPWLYLGMDLAMGPSVDQPQSQWQAAFIPEVLATAVAQLTDIFAERTTYYQATTEAQTNRPLLYLVLVSLLLAGLLLLLARPWQTRARKSRQLVVILWLTVCSLAGWFLLWLWFASSHTDAANNWNIVLLNPLYIPAMLLLGNKPGASRWLSMLVASSTITAVFGAMLSTQNLLAPLAFFGLPMLAIFYLLWTSTPKAENC